MCEFVIDINEISANLKKIKNSLDKGTKICGVVKADAYGFGLKKIYELLKDKVDYFAVARLNEFLELKSFGCEKPCLILAPLVKEDLELAINQGAEITVSRNETIKEIDEIVKKNKQKTKIHIKVDTGMNRFGFNSFNELKKTLKEVKNTQNIDVVGLYSHFYNLDDKEIEQRQRSRFIFFKKLLNNFGFDPICHISSSKGIKNKSNHFNMVRLGIDLYHSNKHKFVCDVLETKKVKKNQTIGYGGTFQAKKDMFIAVCSCGYADGLSRAFKRSYVLINDYKCPIRGNICMDSFMVEIPKDKVNVGDQVVIFGKSKEKHISVCDLAKLYDTIPYEIYTSISKRVKRVYV